MAKRKTVPPKVEPCPVCGLPRQFLPGGRMGSGIYCVAHENLKAFVEAVKAVISEQPDMETVIRNLVEALSKLEGTKE